MLAVAQPKKEFVMQMPPHSHASFCDRKAFKACRSPGTWNCKLDQRHCTFLPPILYVLKCNLLCPAHKNPTNTIPNNKNNQAAAAAASEREETEKK